jgi:hypothetical protein
VTTALPLLIVLAATAGGPPPVWMNAVDCPGFNDADVRRALAVEIPDQLRARPEPVSPGSLVVDVWCPKGEVIASVTRPGETAAQVRRIPGESATGNAGARTVALAIAELIRIAAAPAPLTTARAASPGPAPPAADDDRPTGLSAIGLVGSAFTSGAPLLGGAEIRWSFLWPRERVPAETGWAFGFTYAVEFLATSFSSGTGEMSIASMAPAWLAQRRFGRFRPEIAIGDQIGFAFFRSDSPTVPSFPSSDRRIVNGPFADVALAFLMRRTYVRAAFEAVLPLPAPGRFCSPTDCVDFSGAWLLGSVTMGLTF